MRRTPISASPWAVLRVRALRVAALALPVLCAARLVTDEPRPLPAMPPSPHATDVWLDHTDVLPVDPAALRRGEEERLRQALTHLGSTPAAEPRGLGVGFQIVGSVAVLQGDETTTITTGSAARRGINSDSLAAIGRRFIAAFGDNYDQIAVYLAFNDYASLQSLAYQMPVKNDIQGIGLSMFDGSAAYGSPSGRLQTMLNMKRILAYGRGAADDPANDLYAVWAQEAAHRWVVYFRYRREGDTENKDTLLGRQKAHWARNVQADASIMDGYLWRDNSDGTFTPLERDKRYGALDQYGMGLRAAQDVPAFFILDDVRQEVDDQPVAMNGAVRIQGRYKAQKTVLTVQDIIRAMGPRVPATDPAAADMRMGVVLLTFPGVPPEAVVGESYRIDNTRRLWDPYYNEAGGGRGKVCTELLRPCRGLALSYGEPTTIPGDVAAASASGQLFRITIPVTNVGTAAGATKVKIDGRGVLTFARDTVDVPALAPGAKTEVAFQGVAPYGTACAQLLSIDLSTVDKSARPTPSLGTATVTIGEVPGPRDDLENASTGGWKVNPDGDDTAQTGRWELGTPERSEAFEFVMQPGAAFSGQRAFVTGAARGTDASANDVSGGRTTLESPPMALAGLSSPHLSYQVYFVAADFQNEVLVPAASDSLAVQASTDGKTWTEVDRLTGMALGWQRRLIKLGDLLPAEALSSPSLRFRFVAEDADQNTVVEAVVDDIGLVGEAPACALPPAPPGPPTAGEPPGGCGCRLGSGRAPGGMGLLALVALALLRRRRR
jgi:MYXO-CTERM domain-containing protein